MRCYAKCARDPQATAGDVTDQLLPLRAGGAEVDGACVAIERLRHGREIDRLVAALELVGRQVGHEAAQPKSFEVGCSCHGGGFSLVDNVHAYPPRLRIIAEPIRRGQPPRTAKGWPWRSGQCYAR